MYTGKLREILLVNRSHPTEGYRLSRGLGRPALSRPGDAGGENNRRLSGWTGIASTCGCPDAVFGQPLRDEGKRPFPGAGYGRPDSGPLLPFGLGLRDGSGTGATAQNLDAGLPTAN